MEVTSNAQAAQSLTSLHIKRNDSAVDKFFEENRNRQIQAQSPISAYRNTPPQAKSLNQNEVFLKVDNRLIRFSLDDFLYLENVGDYVSIKTKFCQNPSLVHYQYQQNFVHRRQCRHN
jgi:hypothetical protein